MVSGSKEVIFYDRKVIKVLLDIERHAKKEQ